MTDQALRHLTIIDLSDRIAGGFCTKFLADFGATVIKVERPGQADLVRGMGPFLADEPHPDRGGLHLYLNANKKSVTLNYATSTGVDLLLRLAAQADVLMETHTPGEQASLSLTTPALRTANPAALLDFSMNGRIRERNGNDHPSFAPPMTRSSVRGTMLGWPSPCKTTDSSRTCVKSSACRT